MRDLRTLIGELHEYVGGAAYAGPEIGKGWLSTVDQARPSGFGFFPSKPQDPEHRQIRFRDKLAAKRLRLRKLVQSWQELKDNG